MTKVYPNYNSREATRESPSEEKQAVVTVWKKSLLFNCTGFTVFDAKGNLVFRVDNYVAGNKGEIVLMDAAGKPLLTIRRKRLSLGDKWMVYEGEGERESKAGGNPLFCVRKHVNIVKGKRLAYVQSSGNSSAASKGREVIMYEIEGSYSQRSCAVYDQKRRRVAEIKRKEAAVGGVKLGGDVFSLLVDPHRFDTATAMALVILLDQMFGSSSSSSFTH